MIVLIPLLVAVIGLLMYFATAGKPSEVGKLLFFAGVLVLLFRFAGAAVHLLR